MVHLHLNELRFPVYGAPECAMASGSMPMKLETITL